MSRFDMLARAATASIAVAVAAPSLAQEAGDIQARIFATTVQPDGKISKVISDPSDLTMGAQTEADNSVVPTVAIEYFLSPNFSVETICCVTPHNVTGEGSLAGARLIDDAVILPATLTAKYHFNLGGSIKPYLGAGPAYFFIFGEDVGAQAAALGVTDVDLSDELGFALQAGADIALGNNGWSVSLDAKRYFIGTTATFRAGDDVALRTEHDLDPWVLSAGVGFRF